MNADEILALADLKSVEVKVPEWNGEVFHVWTLTAGEREEWEHMPWRADAKDRKMIFRAGLLCFALRDRSGSRIFRTDQAESLATKNAAAVERLYRVAARLSLVEDSDIEELAKNS